MDNCLVGISMLANGIYFIELKTTKSRSIQKFVKE